MNALIYVHDPMCSWCYALAPVWQTVRQQLPKTLALRYVVGGLAPDSDEPMPKAQQAMIQQHWQRIESVVTNLKFNFDFWTLNTPKRSTYPSCRAALLARQQGLECEMIHAIQTAYYQQAQNPAERSTLIRLAGDIGLDETSFAEQLDHPDTHAALMQDLQFARRIGANHFPSLWWQQDDHFVPIAHNYHDARKILHEINRYLES